MTARRLAVIVIATALAACAHAQTGPKLEPIFEEGFEDAEVGAIPEGWRVAYGNEADVMVADSPARTGERSVRIIDSSEDTATGLQSEKIPIEPDEVYYVNGWWRGEQGVSCSIYLEFWDAEGTRIDKHSFGCKGTGDWVRRTGSAVAPADAVAATMLLYSWSGAVTDGHFDDLVLGIGSPTLYDRSPKPPTQVDHPVGLYSEEDLARAKANIDRHDWARRQFQEIINRTEWWMELPDDQIATWIPEGTPFRVCNCPACGAQWGVGPWRFHEDGTSQCKRCETVFPNEAYPETATEEHVNPLGERETITSYMDEDGNRYRLEGLRRYGRIAKLSQAGWLGRAYALTGDVAYVEKLRSILLRLAEVYPAYIAHDWYRIYRDYNNLQSGKLSGWKLHDANVFIELSLAYDLTVDSGVYSDEDRSIIEEGAFREAGRLFTTTSPRGCCVNDGPFLMAAGGYIGKLLGNHDYVAWSIEPPHGFFGFIEENFWRDGHWEDGSPSYENMALAKFYVLPEILQGYSDPPSYTGDDRYDDLDMLANPLMSKVLIAGMHVTAPDGYQPANNDSTFGAGFSARHAEENYFWFPTERNLRLMAHAYNGRAAETGSEYALFRRDPDLSFEGVEPLDLSADSLVRPGLGWAILRAGEGAEQVMTMVDFGPIRGHAHADKLNFAFWAHGRELVTDLGYLGARHHFQPWLRACAAHNELLVDGDAQRKVSGELLSFAPGDFAQSIRAKAPNTYEQASRYERTLTMVAPPDGPAYLVDVFDVEGGERHLMAFHGDGETFASELDFAADDEEFITKAAESGDWIRTQEKAAPDGPFTADWRIEPEDELGVRITVLDEADAAWHITAPGLRNRSNTWGDRTFHGLLWQQPGPTSRFVSVIEAVSGAPALGSVERIATSSDACTGVRVERDGATDYVFVSDHADPVSADSPAGLRFAARQAVVSVRDGAPVFARFVDGAALSIGDLSLTCDGPMSSTIAAFDDAADTISTEAALPAGEALRGQQLLVSGRVDGPYAIDRVERTDAGSVIHLADEPIMRVEAGDAFTIPSIVEVAKLDDGTWTIRADCEVEADLPRPADFNSRVMLRGTDQWHELPHECTSGAVSFRIPAEGLTGESAVLLLTDGELDFTDVQPPAVERIRVDGVIHSGAEQIDLGYLEDPRVIALDLHDAKNPLADGPPEVSLLGPTARIDASLVLDRDDHTRGRAIVRFRKLPPGEYELRIRVLDRAANKATVRLRFNTRGLVFRARGLPVVEDSGKLSKPLGGLGTQFYRAEEPGDYVVYELDVPEAGAYDVSLIASGYPSYGTYQVSLDDRELGQPVDAWRTALDATGVVAPLGAVKLDAGTHRLRFDILGKNERGTGYYIGWHSLVLRPVTE